MVKSFIHTIIALGWISKSFFRKWSGNSSGQLQIRIVMYPDEMISSKLCWLKSYANPQVQLPEWTVRVCPSSFAYVQEFMDLIHLNYGNPRLHFLMTSNKAHKISWRMVMEFSEKRNIVMIKCHYFCVVVLLWDVQIIDVMLDNSWCDGKWMVLQMEIFPHMGL